MSNLQPPSRINFERDYGFQRSLFGGEPLGVFDSIHQSHPEIFALYKLMKSLDWDENEFPYAKNKADFKNAPESISKKMIETLVWQWEADTVASLTAFTVVQPFINDSSLLAALSKINDNEILHALTYSEIVRTSFDDPEEVLKEVVANKEALIRVETVQRVCDETARLSAQLTLGEISRDDPRILEQMILYYSTMLCLERIQFMASFAVTFSIERLGLFGEIANGVTMIARDEYNIHVQLDKLVLKNELSRPEGRQAFERMRGRISEVLHEVVECERAWTEHLFRDGEEHPGLTKDSILDFMYYSGTVVANYLGIEPRFKIVNHNPLKFMDKKLDLNNEQKSPQEENSGNYRLGGFQQDGDDFDLEVD